MTTEPRAPVELLASYWTLSGAAVPHSDHEYSTFSFRERVEACARVGFSGLGLWHADLSHTLESMSLKDMKRILDDNGIRHVELEFLVDWFIDDPARRGPSNERRKLLLDAAEALGARHVKVGDFFQTVCPMPKLIEEFQKLCRDGAERGTRILFEMMPFSIIDSLPKAQALVEGAAASNGGIIFDLWHIVKLKIPYDAVARFPARYFMGMEMNDGYLQAPAGMEMVEETTGHRKFCGQGEFDIKGFAAALARSPYRGPIGIEVLSRELRTWPLDKAVATAYQTTLAPFVR